MKNDYTDNIQRRLLIIEGHLQKVRSMLKEKAYCLDVLNQSLAVQSALKEVDTLILQNHLNSCVADAIKQGKTESTVEELMKVIKRSRKT